MSYDTSVNREVCWRYLASHWEDTLKNMRFMVSAPNAFKEDPCDCVCEVDGVLPEDVWQRYRKTHNWRDEARRLNIPEDELGALLNSKLLNRDFLSRVIREKISDRSAMSEKYRILCTSNSCASLRTEMHMWEKYAGKFSGVRIGLMFEQGMDLNGAIRVQEVSYCDDGPVWNLSDMTEFPPNGEFLIPTIMTKREEYSVEQEYRLLIMDSRCDHEKGRSFWHCRPEFIRVLDLGPLFERSRILELAKLARSACPHIVVRKAEFSEDGKEINYQKVEYA